MRRGDKYKKVGAGRILPELEELCHSRQGTPFPMIYPASRAIGIVDFAEAG